MSHFLFSCQNEDPRFGFSFYGIVDRLLYMFMSWGGWFQNYRKQNASVLRNRSFSVKICHFSWILVCGFEVEITPNFLGCVLDQMPPVAMLCGPSCVDFVFVHTSFQRFWSNYWVRFRVTATKHFVDSAKSLWSDIPSHCLFVFKVYAHVITYDCWLNIFDHAFLNTCIYECLTRECSTWWRPTWSITEVVQEWIRIMYFWSLVVIFNFWIHGCI